MFRCRKLSTHHPTCRRHVPTLWRYRFEKFDTTSYQEIILSLGFFRRETASGFYPWGYVVSPRERVAEGLCGWRHGNSFPMTQSAQSHRQMRSIPRCSKAVFYVFVFDSIHNSITLHNLSPQIFHRSKKAQPITLIIQIQLFGQKKGGCLKKQPPNFIFGQKFSVSDVVGI